MGVEHALQNIAHRGGLLQEPKAAFKPEPAPNSYSLLGLWVWIYLKKSPHKAGFGFSAERLDQRCTSRRTEPVNS